MSAGIYNFTLNQGATFTRQMTVKENNSPLNLTGLYSCYAVEKHL